MFYFYVNLVRVDLPKMFSKLTFCYQFLQFTGGLCDFGVFFPL